MSIQKQRPLGSTPLIRRNTPLSAPVLIALLLTVIAGHGTAAGLADTAPVLWEAAPARASSGPDDASSLPFLPMSDTNRLDRLLIEDEGYLWLKTSLTITGNDEALLIGGGRLAWKAWINGNLVAEGGAFPPWWFPANPIPEIVPLEKLSEDGSTVIWIKIYGRRGSLGWEGPVVVGEVDSLRFQRLLYAARGIIVPLITLVLGLLIAIGAGIRYSRQKDRFDSSWSLFALFLALSKIGIIATLLPGNHRWPWTPFGLLSLLAALLSLHFFRILLSRGTGGRDYAVYRVSDAVLLIIAGLGAIWAALIGEIPVPSVPWVWLDRFLAVDFLSVYAGIVFLWGVLGLFTASVKGYRASAGIWILAGIPVLVGIVGAWISGDPRTGIAWAVDLGLPTVLGLSLLIRLPAFGSEYRELRPPAPSRESTRTPSRTPDRDERLARALRGTLYPETLPWDPLWEVSVVRRGPAAPATGFHDAYVDNEGNLAGLSLMDVGGDHLEPILLAHLVRTELARRFRPDVPLARILRSVHRKCASTATMAGRPVTGVLARLVENRVEYVALDYPPLLYRRSGAGGVKVLRTNDNKGRNPALGTDAFRSAGLRTLRIVLAPGDLLVLHDPAFSTTRNPQSREAWGDLRLRRALGASTGRSSSEISRDLMEDFLDFLGTDEIPVPVNLMVLRRKG